MNGVSLFEQIPDPLLEAAPLAPLMGRVTRFFPELRSGEGESRREVRRRRRVALAAALVWLLAHLWAYGVRTDAQELTRTYEALQIGVPLALAVLAAVVALSPGRWGLGVDQRLTACWAVLGPLGFWMVALGAPPPYPPPSDPLRWVHILLCLDLTLTFVALPLLAALIALQRTFVGAVRARATLIGGSAGLLAGATMNLHCPNVDVLHVALGHGTPVLLATCFGALVLSRSTRV